MDIVVKWIAVFQFVLVTLGGICFAGLAFYVKAKIFEGLSSFKDEVRAELTEVRAELANFLLEASKRDNQSQLDRVALSARVVAVESGHKSITDRLDQLVRAIWHDKRPVVISTSQLKGD